MTQHQSYTKPAIREAIIDFQVEPSPDVSLSNLENIHNSLKVDYPLCQKLNMTVQETIQDNSNDLEQNTDHNILVYRSINNTQKQVLQTRLTHFTFSKLSPYQGWELFREETQRLWKIYQSVTHSIQIKHIIVRYINCIDLPLNSKGSLDFQEYLRVLPEIPPELPQFLQGYFMKLEIPQVDIDGVSTIQQTIITPSKEDKISFLLDIELSCQTNFSSDLDSHWELLERLRIRKNEIFEACITDQTRSLLNNV